MAVAERGAVAVMAIVHTKKATKQGHGMLAHRVVIFLEGNTARAACAHRVDTPND